MKNEKYTFEDLREIMRRLRAPGGCPWDAVQTHESLKKHAVEEAYELAEAIDSGNPEKIADESGDLLLQVVFHAQIAEENGSYSIDDVSDAICRKLIHRHPHIFGAADAEQADWDAIKRADRSLASVAMELRGISAYLPALMRAEKIQRKAEKFGYPFEKAASSEASETELGAELFSLVQQCREQGFDPELALTRYLRQFIDEFEKFEQSTKENKK